MSHILPSRIASDQWPATDHRHPTLSNHHLHLTTNSSGKKSVDSAQILRPNDVLCPDGVIHWIERLIVPRSVQEDFNRRRNLRDIAAVLPEGGGTKQSAMEDERAGVFYGGMAEREEWGEESPSGPSSADFVIPKGLSLAWFSNFFRMIGRHFRYCFDDSEGMALFLLAYGWTINQNNKRFHGDEVNEYASQESGQQLHDQNLSLPKN